MNLIVLFACAVWAKRDYGVAMDRGYMLLSDANFDQVLRDFDNVLLMFSAPTCTKCRQLEPDLRLAASHLAQEDPPIYIAKIDYQENEVVKKRFPNIKRFPHFKFVKRGIPQEYTSPYYQFTDVHNWAYKRVHPPVKPVSVREDLDEEINKHEFVCMYIGSRHSTEYRDIY